MNYIIRRHKDFIKNRSRSEKVSAKHSVLEHRLRKKDTDLQNYRRLIHHLRMTPRGLFRKKKRGSFKRTSKMFNAFTRYAWYNAHCMRYADWTHHEDMFEIRLPAKRRN